MKTLNLTPVILAFACILFTSCAPEEDGIYFEKFEEKEVKYSSMELEILEIVNDYRSSIGTQPLEKLNVISTVAESHTTYMAQTGIVSHDNFAERHKQLVENAKAKQVGENVGYGFSSAKGVVNAWLKSDGHRSIIENPEFTHFGISTEQNQSGRNYFTQIFIKR